VITLDRLYRAAGRISSCVALSPLLCVRLLFWRASLPFLKYVVPVRVLTRFMWSAPPARRDDSGRADARLRSLSYIWQNGGRLLVSRNCLERSLVLYRLLSQSGSNPSLVVGVSRADTGIAGHVWVETDGRVFFDDMVHRYDRFATFGVNGRPAEIRP
jgi:transglutaminase superfamily protein